MTIIAIGLDATEIRRIEQAIERFGDRFLQRVFTEGEIAYCRARRRAGPHFAARFAAKEAGMKALGTGHARGVQWRDIEVVRDTGPPRLVFHGAARRRLLGLGGSRALLTLTHSQDLALAHVLLVSE